jgi:hypothetical protein
MVAAWDGWEHQPRPSHPVQPTTLCLAACRPDICGSFARASLLARGKPYLQPQQEDKIKLRTGFATLVPSLGPFIGTDKQKAPQRSLQAQVSWLQTPASLALYSKGGFAQ